jgi:hypothetical protein
MNKSMSLCLIAFFDRRGTSRNSDSLNGNNAVTVTWQNATRHYFYTVVVIGECLHRVAGMLYSLNGKPASAVCKCVKAHGDAIHHHTIERWLVALGID